MKTQWRVVQSGNSGDGFAFTLELVTERDGVLTILEQYGGNGSVKDLRQQMKEMNAAFDKPVLFHRPAQLIEPPTKKRGKRA